MTHVSDMTHVTHRKLQCTAEMIAMQELSNAFSQASAAAAAESQPAVSKPPSPHLTPPPHPIPAANTAGGPSPPTLLSTGHAQLQSFPQPQILAPNQTHASDLNQTRAQSQTQSQTQSQSGSHLSTLTQSQQQPLTQPSVASSQAQPAPQSSVLPAGQRAVLTSAPGLLRPPALPSSASAGWCMHLSFCMPYMI